MKRSIKPFLIFLLGISSCLISNARPLPKKHFFMVTPPTLPTVTAVNGLYEGGDNQILLFRISVNTPPPQDVGVYYVVTWYDSPGYHTRTEELYSVVFANSTRCSTPEIDYTDFYGIKSCYVEYEDWE